MRKKECRLWENEISQQQRRLPERSLSASAHVLFIAPLVPATWRSVAQTSMRAELPSEKVPTTGRGGDLPVEPFNSHCWYGFLAQCSLGESRSRSGLLNHRPPPFCGFFQLHLPQLSTTAWPFSRAASYSPGRVCLEASWLPASLFRAGMAENTLRKNGQYSAVLGRQEYFPYSFQHAQALVTNELERTPSDLCLSATGKEFTQAGPAPLSSPRRRLKPSTISILFTA